jgi:hypothetical protein
MMHNPFQSYQTDPTLGAYAGMANPFSLPYTAMQTSVTNPATFNPLASALGVGGLSQLGQTGYAGIPNYGNIHPQQLQLASLLTSQGSIPQVFGQSPWQNPYAVQNPWITGGLQNPLLTAALQQPLLNPILAQQFGLQPMQPYSPYQQIGQGSPFGQQGLPFGQQGSPYGQIGLPFGQQSSPYAQQGSPYGQIGLPLAPQSWVGQAGPFGGGQGFGQIHPLLAQQLLAQQLGARGLHSQGITPWGF